MSSGDIKAAEILLRHVAIDGVRQATQELQQRNTLLDERDMATARLLLNQYTSGLANLRAVTHLAAQRIADAAVSIDDGKRFVRHQAKAVPTTTRDA